jgi:hypothetical protein
MSESPIERLLRAVDPEGDDGTRASNFARGLVLGALVGAAIAGSTIWQRRQSRPKVSAGPADPDRLETASADPPLHRG